LIDEALRARLVAVAGVSSRVYPAKLPQAPTLPAVTYQRVTGNRVHSTQGPSGLANPRYQVDVWARTYVEMLTVAKAVRQGLDGYQGEAGAWFSPLCVNDFDFYEPGVDLHRRTLDFSIWHQEI
jgi:hypothetical protein